MERVCTIAIAALALISCSGDSTSPTSQSIGAYTLTSVDSRALLATVTVNGFTETFTSGTLTVADSSYTFSVCVRSAFSQTACGAGYEMLSSAAPWFIRNGSLVFVDAASDSSIETTWSQAIAECAFR
jgi:hypothetical protein